MTTLSTKAELLAVNMTCQPLSTTLVYYLLYITIVCPTLHFSSLVNHNSSILDHINTCTLINREGLHLVEAIISTFTIRSLSNQQPPS